MSRLATVETPHGPGRLHVHEAGTPVLTLLLSHGAGGGVESPDLEALAGALPAAGVTVAVLEQPWRVAGRRVATGPPTLDDGLRAAAGHLVVTGPLVVGGRSAGARSAARTARELGAAGCLALAFPLHPPREPESSRLPELLGAGVPTLVVQGERDALGRPGEFPEPVGPQVRLVAVPGADHGFAVLARGPSTREQTLSLVVETVLEWLQEQLLGR